MTTLLKRVLLGASVASLLLISALPAAAADDARIRVLHASPDAPAVDIYVNDSVVEALTNVPFGAISDYLSVPAGDYNIKVYPTGTSSTAVIDADVTLSGNTSYTVAAINPVASIQPAVFIDDPALTAGQALVRVIHLSPDAPAVDVAPDGAAPADAVVKGLEFPAATDYLALAAGSYDLEVRLAGTTDVALQLDPIEVAAGRAYSVFAIGSAAAEPLGGNELTVLAPLDGQWMPDTSTETGAPAGTDLLLVGLLLTAGLATFAMFIARGRDASEAR